MSKFEIMQNGEEFYFQEIESGDLKTDFFELVLELDKKFKFEDLIKFSNELLDFISMTKRTKDLDKIKDMFFQVIFRNATEKNIEIQADNALKELGVINGNN